MADRREPAADVNPVALAAEIDARLRALPDQNTPNRRAIRREYSRMLRNADPSLILDVARELYNRYDQQGIARELILCHKRAFGCLGEAEVEEFGRGINSWWSVDGFARDLAGRAWREGQVSDALIHQWAHSPDRWWRRAALVSTVPLNVKAQGGTGDVPRTLEVCRMLPPITTIWSPRVYRGHCANSCGTTLKRYSGSWQSTSMSWRRASSARCETSWRPGSRTHTKRGGSAEHEEDRPRSHRSG